MKQEYAELLEKSGNSLTLSNYELSRLINLEITSLKSLFSAKVLEAENLGIKSFGVARCYIVNSDRGLRFGCDFFSS
ncbi:MAG: hypothetical protein ACLTOX_00995 [Streptococcus thermophilus]